MYTLIPFAIIVILWALVLWLGSGLEIPEETEEADLQEGQDNEHY